MNETIECLNHIKKLKNQEKISIIIVDNNTLTDEDFKKISKYTNDIIKLEENLGFAKANNIGIQYAKEKYNPEYYFVINNDVFIYQKDIVKKIEEIYEKYKFDMLGPKIDSPTKESVNPFPIIKDVDKEIKRCEKLIKIYQKPVKTFFLEKYIKIKHFIKKPIKPINGKKTEINIPLHGCAIVFSKKYIEKYKYAFVNETFLFHEEDILYKRIIKDKLLSVYSPKKERIKSLKILKSMEC